MFKIGNPGWRALIIWWLGLGLALVVVLVLLWAVRSDDGPGSEPNPAAVESPSPADTPSSGSADRPGSQLVPEAPGESAVVEPGQSPEPGSPADPPPAASSPGDGSQPAEFDLPENWDRLGPDTKIFLNPGGCDREVEEIDLADGSCRPRSSLTKPTPWNPVAIGRVSITELDRNDVLLACAVGDPVVSIGPGADIWPTVQGEIKLVQSAGPPPEPGTDLTCALRLTLEMTVDGFYFSDGCRAFRRGFIRLEFSPAASLPRGYDSLDTAGPNARCTKEVVPVAKGTQLERIFKFDLKGADFNRQLERVRFSQLNPVIQFEGRFRLVIGQLSVTPGRFDGIVKPNP